MIFRRTLPLLLAATSITLTRLAAQEDPGVLPGELRIVVGAVPGITHGLDDSQQRVGTSGEILALCHHRLDHLPVSFILGGGLFSDDRRARVRNPDDTAAYDAQGIVLTAGVRYAVMHQLSLETRLEGRGGVGRISAKQTFSNGDFEVLGDYGRYGAAAATVGAYYAFAIPASFGVEAGYDTFQGRSDFVGHAVSIRGNGLVVRLGLGYGF